MNIATRKNWKLDDSALSEEQLAALSDSQFEGHRVSLQLFEGPLDLLLYLIRENQYDIRNIPIHKITAQFMEFLVVMDEIDITYAGDFLVTAATLMQIKARMLLPEEKLEDDDDEEETEQDPREALMERLQEYQRLQEAAETLKDMEEERALQFPRPPAKSPTGAKNGTEKVAELLDDVSTFDLLRTLQRVLTRVDEKPVALVQRESFSLEDRTEGILARIKTSESALNFDTLCDDCEERIEVVITFLAILELVRRRRIIMTQEQLFGEILVSAN